MIVNDANYIQLYDNDIVKYKDNEYKITILECGIELVGKAGIEFIPCKNLDKLDDISIIVGDDDSQGSLF